MNMKKIIRFILTGLLILFGYAIAVQTLLAITVNPSPLKTVAWFFIFAFVVYVIFRKRKKK